MAWLGVAWVCQEDRSLFSSTGDWLLDEDGCFSSCRPAPSLAAFQQRILLARGDSRRENSRMHQRQQDCTEEDLKSNAQHDFEDKSVTSSKKSVGTCPEGWL